MEVVEIARVTVDDLLHDPAGVLERVSAGEQVLLVEDGVALAVIGPPDLSEAMAAGMVKAGILDSDWQSKQAELKQWILANPPMPAEPHKPPLSATLIEMREEETR